MKKGQMIKTPHGDAVVRRFLIMTGYSCGVEFKVSDTGEVMKEFRTVVDRWQFEATKVAQ